MDIKIKTKNLSLTDRVQDMVDDKLGRLEKFLPEDADATVTLKGKKNYVKVEMTIPMKRYTLRVEEEDRDLHNAIDKVQSVMERQIRKYKTRLTNKKRKGESHEVIEAPIEMIEQMEEDDFKYTITGYGISTSISRSGNLDAWADYENGGNGG